MTKSLKTPASKRKLTPSAVAPCSEMARVLLMHAVSTVLDGCGNSYSNAYTERWLTNAKMLGAYHGRVIGNIIELRDEWEAWLDAHGGLPDFPNTNAQPAAETPGGKHST